MASKGSFFAVDRRMWSRLPEIGMNEAVAYLVLAQATGRNHKATSWSVKALKTYAGISWERGNIAIGNLRERGFIRNAGTHTRTRPRYELATFNEWYQAESARLSATMDFSDRELVKRIQTGDQPEYGRRGKHDRERADKLSRLGALTRDSQGIYRLPECPTGDSDANLIWLPNAIVTGTERGEESPVRRLRATGDVWALRLFVDLYFAHNLLGDGGIPPKVIWRPFERKVVGQQGPYTVWGFADQGARLNWVGPFEPHRNRPKRGPEAHVAAWDSVDTLERLGLLHYIPHVFESSSAQAEIIHPYGIGGRGEETIETELGRAAHEAGVICACNAN
jgi:hypothetical protein